MSFGFAGALVPGLRAGALLSAHTVVDPRGRVLWRGEALPVPNAHPAVICAVEAVTSEPTARRALAERTGAVAVDMESGVLAATGRLAGVVRAVSDEFGTPLGLLANAASPDGETNWGVVGRAALLEPVATARTALGARRGLSSLAAAATVLAGRDSDRSKG